jgi:hypothetical protein
MLNSVIVVYDGGAVVRAHSRERAAEHAHDLRNGWDQKRVAMLKIEQRVVSGGAATRHGRRNVAVSFIWRGRDGETGEERYERAGDQDFGWFPAGEEPGEKELFHHTELTVLCRYMHCVQYQEDSKVQLRQEGHPGIRFPEATSLGHENVHLIDATVEVDGAWHISARRVVGDVVLNGVFSRDTEQVRQPVSRASGEVFATRCKIPISSRARGRCVGRLRGGNGWAGGRSRCSRTSLGDRFV